MNFKLSIVLFTIAVSANGVMEALPLAYLADGKSNTVDVLNTITGRVESSLALPGFPAKAMAAAPDGETAYIAINGECTGAASEASGCVLVVDGVHNTIKARIPVGVSPAGIAAAPDGRFVYVANQGSNSVSVIDTTDNTVKTVLPVGLGPRVLAIAQGGASVYVANSGGKSISIISTRSMAVTATLPLGGSPSHIVVAPNRPLAYFAVSGSLNTGGIGVINTSTNSVVAGIRTPVAPQQLAITPDGRHLYATATDSVLDIDTESNVLTAKTALTGASGISIAPDGQHAYLTQPGVSQLIIVNLSDFRVAQVIPGIWNIIAHLAPVAYVVVPNGPNLVVINTFTEKQSTIATSDATANLTDVAVTPDGTKAYVSDVMNSAVWAVDLVHQSILAKIPVGIGPAGIAVTPDAAFAYVAVGSSNSVTVIQTADNTISGTIAVEKSPFRVAMTPKGAAYVLNDGSLSVSVIDTTSKPPAVVATIGNLPGAPFDVAISPDGSRAYVAVLGSVLVIDTTAQPPSVVSSVSIPGANMTAAVTQDGSEVFSANSTQFNQQVQTFIAVINAGTMSFNDIVVPDALRWQCIRMDQNRTAYALATAPDGNFHVYALDVPTGKVQATYTIPLTIDTRTIAIAIN